MDELGEVDRRKGVAYYHQLYTLLVRALGEGVIPAGSALPSETELMQRFRVSRNTVRRALGRLEEEKRIVRRRGSGSFARSHPASEFSPDRLAEILQDFDATGSRTRSRLITVARIATPEHIRRRWPEFEDRSVVVQRSRSYKGESFMLSTSHVPESVGQQLTRRGLDRQVVLAALDRQGIRPASAEQTLTAVSADAFAARHLGVALSAPLLCVQRIVRDADRRVIEHQNDLYRPDRYSVRFNMSIDRSKPELRWTSDATSDPVPAWV